MTEITDEIIELPSVPFEERAAALINGLIDQYLEEDPRLLPEVRYNTLFFRDEQHAIDYDLFLGRLIDSIYIDTLSNDTIDVQFIFDIVESLFPTFTSARKSLYERYDVIEEGVTDSELEEYERLNIFNDDVSLSMHNSRHFYGIGNILSFQYGKNQIISIDPSNENDLYALEEFADFRLEELVSNTGSLGSLHSFLDEVETGWFWEPNTDLAAHKLPENVDGTTSSNAGNGWPDYVNGIELGESASDSLWYKFGLDLHMNNDHNCQTNTVILSLLPYVQEYQQRDGVLVKVGNKDFDLHNNTVYTSVGTVNWGEGPGNTNINGSGAQTHTYNTQGQFTITVDIAFKSYSSQSTFFSEDVQMTGDFEWFWICSADGAGESGRFDFSSSKRANWIFEYRHGLVRKLIASMEYKEKNKRGKWRKEKIERMELEIYGLASQDSDCLEDKILENNKEKDEQKQMRVQDGWHIGFSKTKRRPISSNQYPFKATIKAKEGGVTKQITVYFLHC